MYALCQFFKLIFFPHHRYGLTFMLLSSLGAGLIFTILVWVDSHTWIYIRKRYVNESLGELMEDLEKVKFSRIFSLFVLFFDWSKT